MNKKGGLNMAVNLTNVVTKSSMEAYTTKLLGYIENTVNTAVDGSFKAVECTGNTMKFYGVKPEDIVTPASATEENPATEPLFTINFPTENYLRSTQFVSEFNFQDWVEEDPEARGEVDDPELDGKPVLVQTFVVEDNFSDNESVDYAFISLDALISSSSITGSDSISVITDEGVSTVSLNVSELAANKKSITKKVARIDPETGEPVLDPETGEPVYDDVVVTTFDNAIEIKSDGVYVPDLLGSSEDTSEDYSIYGLKAAIGGINDELDSITIATSEELEALIPDFDGNTTEEAGSGEDNVEGDGGRS
jgi:hypothetical protein